MPNNQRTAIVTGGVGGIGAAIVEHLANRNYAVAVLDLVGPTTDADPQANAELRYIETDVGSSQSVRAAVDVAHDALGHIDLLVNAAGVSSMYHALDIPDAEWERIMRINTQGVFSVCRAAIPLMVDGSSVVNIASAAGKQGAPLLAHYAASKFAVIGLTQTLALELAPRIRVNAVCPGYIRTPMQDREIQWEAMLSGQAPQEILNGYVAGTPMGRLGTPQDVARLVGFLASDDANFITGQSVNVDGGLVLH